MINVVIGYKVKNDFCNLYKDYFIKDFKTIIDCYSKAKKFCSTHQGYYIERIYKNI